MVCQQLRPLVEATLVRTQSLCLCFAGWIPFNLNQKLTLSQGRIQLRFNFSRCWHTRPSTTILQLTGFNSIWAITVNVGAVARIEKELTVVGQSAPGGYTSVASQTVDVAEGESGSIFFSSAPR